MRFALCTVPVISCLLVLSLPGCSKNAQSPKPRPPSVQATSNTAAPTVAVQPAKPLAPQPIRASRSTRPAQQQDRRRPDQPAEAPPFRVCSFQSKDGISYAGLVYGETPPDIVKEGDTYRGYEIATVDCQKKRLIVRKAGREFMVQAIPDPTTVALDSQQPPAVAKPSPKPSGVEELATSDVVLPQTNAAMDLGAVPLPAFEPTPNEVQSGINPNDPGTWPEGYRGPGIERALLMEH